MSGTRTPLRRPSERAPSVGSVWLYLRTPSGRPVPSTLKTWVIRWGERTRLSLEVLAEPEAPKGGLLVHLTAPTAADVKGLWTQLGVSYEVGFLVGEAPLP